MILLVDIALDLVLQWKCASVPGVKHVTWEIVFLPPSPLTQELPTGCFGPSLIFPMKLPQMEVNEGILPFLITAELASSVPYFICQKMSVWLLFRANCGLSQCWRESYLPTFTSATWMPGPEYTGYKYLSWINDSFQEQSPEDWVPTRYTPINLLRVEGLGSYLESTQEAKVPPCSHMVGGIYPEVPRLPSTTQAQCSGLTPLAVLGGLYVVLKIGTGIFPMPRPGP